MRLLPVALYALVIGCSTTGPAAGTSGRVTATITSIRDGVYFLSWLEANGTSVSNVVDLKTMRVRSYVTFAAGGERKGIADEGILRRSE